MAIIDVVKWNAPDDVYAWKFPSEELATWTQLVVSESQEAVVLKEGRMDGPFKAGRYQLSTKNIPFLSKLVNIPFGGKSPFSAEVWFVNKTVPLDVKWGTAAPIQVQDPKFNIMLPVRAHGQYGVKIHDTKKFLTKLVGTLPGFSRDKLVSYFRGVITTRVKNSIATAIVKNGTSILEISSDLNEISESLRLELEPELNEFGLRLVNFYVSSISAPEDDPAVVSLKGSLAKKAEMDIIGYTYQQERSFDTMEAAAGNEGSSSSGLMGAGIGLGMGVGMGGAMGGAMGGLAGNLDPNSSTHQAHCSKCNASILASAAFCPACGGKQNAQESSGDFSKTLSCDKCGTKAPTGSKFCPNCSDPFVCCPACGVDNPDENLVCRSCGGGMPRKCSGCSLEVSGDSQFCPNCGITLIKKCGSCEAILLPDVKFCSQCGNDNSSSEDKA